MKKYDLYIVKVIIDDMEMVVKTDRDSTSYSEMKELYDKTKQKISNTRNGSVILVGVNEDGYTTIYSKSIEKKEEIDIVISNLIENINWLLEYSNKADEMIVSMDMTKDMFLKKIELFEDYTIDNEEEVLQLKANLFDELQDILTLRRRVKYNSILSKKIASKLNLKNILKAIDNSIKEMTKNTSVNVTPNTIVKHKELEVKDFFTLDTVNKISQLKKECDKVLITEDKLVGYNRNLAGCKKVESSRKKKVVKQEMKKTKEKSNYMEDILGDIIYKDSELDNIKEDIVCVEKKSFPHVPESHLKSFIKNKSKKFNLMTRENVIMYCYKFEENKSLA